MKVDRWLTPGATGSLLVLTYHGVRADDHLPADANLQGKHLATSALAEQLDLLLDAGYRFITGEELRRTVEAGRPPRGPTVLVTFDDGYANNLHQGLPVLRERGITGVVFAVGDFVASCTPLWVDALEQALIGTGASSVEVDLGGGRETLPLTGPEERRSAESRIRVHWKRLPPEDRAARLQALTEGLGVAGRPLPALYDPLTWDQMRALLDAGWAIGSHTTTHTILGGLEPGVAAAEIRGARALLEEGLGIRCDLFAYPNGLRDDFTLESRRLLREAGKTCALVSIEGRVRPGFDPFAMRRVSVRDGASLLEFRVRATGAVGGLKSLKSAVKTRRGSPAAARR